jgi:adenosyl cobinamide kinase/adenosyl cobinamide phosphate guanylyltransferase
MWLSNLMWRTETPETEIAADCDRLLTAVERTATPLILVSNEVGLGIVPENPLARQFRDRAGALHQRLAQVADLVALAVAGLPLLVKGG